MLKKKKKEKIICNTAVFNENLFIEISITVPAGILLPTWHFFLSLDILYWWACVNLFLLEMLQFGSGDLVKFIFKSFVYHFMRCVRRSITRRVVETNDKWKVWFWVVTSLIFFSVQRQSFWISLENMEHRFYDNVAGSERKRYRIFARWHFANL